VSSFGVLTVSSCAKYKDVFWKKIEETLFRKLIWTNLLQIIFSSTWCKWVEMMLYDECSGIDRIEEPWLFVSSDTWCRAKILLVEILGSDHKISAGSFPLTVMTTTKKTRIWWMSWQQWRVFCWRGKVWINNLPVPDTFHKCSCFHISSQYFSWSKASSTRNMDAVEPPLSGTSDLATVNSNGERSVGWLAEWLLPLVHKVYWGHPTLHPKLVISIHSDLCVLNTEVPLLL
jgi:hypothetical protein